MKTREVIKIALALGCEKRSKAGKGSHTLIVNPKSGARSTVPHEKTDVKDGTLRSIQKAFEADFGKGWLIKPKKQKKKKAKKQK